MNLNLDACIVYLSIILFNTYNSVELVAGVDEVGRGPLAGPVIACAVILSTEHSIKGLKDSKKLSKKKREELFPIIQDQAISIGLGVSDVKTIDKYNIREATFMAMKNALENLDPKPTRALIDGEPIRNISIPNKGIIGGDNLIDSIKAASIIAKVTRDNIMKEYAKIFYEYGFENNSGYGTKFHMEALKKYKATPIHRKSFKPVANALPSMNWVIENNRISWLGNKLAALYLRKLNFKNIEIVEKHPISKRIDIVCKKHNIHHYINVFTSHNKIEERIKRNILNSALETITESNASKDFNNFKQKEHKFGQIFVELQKGGPLILYKDNII